MSAAGEPNVRRQIFFKDETIKSKERFYPEARFDGFTDIDRTVTFYYRVNSLLESSSVVLDIGRGRSASSEIWYPLSLFS